MVACMASSLKTPRQIQTSPERGPDFIPPSESEPEPTTTPPDPRPGAEPDLEPAPSTPDLPPEVNPEAI